MEVARFTFSLFGINTYVVYDPETLECAVIDPGMSSKREYDALDHFIERKNLRVTHLINTHLHVDHAIGDAYVQKKYGLPLEAHPADAPLGARAAEQALMFGITERAEAVAITSPLQDGEVIKIGNGELHVIHVPGHSPGHIALFDKENGFIIGGDILFQGSVGRTDLPGGNHNQLIEGIGKRLMTLPDDTIVYPGHGNETTIGFEREHNPFL